MEERARGKTDARQRAHGVRVALASCLPPDAHGASTRHRPWATDGERGHQQRPLSHARASVPAATASGPSVPRAAERYLWRPTWPVSIPSPTHGASAAPSQRRPQGDTGRGVRRPTWPNSRGCDTTQRPAGGPGAGRPPRACSRAAQTVGRTGAANRPALVAGQPQLPGVRATDDAVHPGARAEQHRSNLRWGTASGTPQ